MRVKAGVALSGVHWSMWYAAAVVDIVRLNNGLGEGTITGAREPADAFGAVRVRGTLHPGGRALDFRVNDLARELWQPFRDAVASSLGPAFDVLLEVDHLHVEYVLADPIVT